MVSGDLSCDLELPGSIFFGTPNSRNSYDYEAEERGVERYTKEGDIGYRWRSIRVKAESARPVLAALGG